MTIYDFAIMCTATTRVHEIKLSRTKQAQTSFVFFQALAVTLTKFCVEPVEHVGAALNLFLQRTLVGLPIYLWPVAIGFGVLMLVLLMIMMFGYRSVFCIRIE